MILHIPHSSKLIPDEYKDQLVLSDQEMDAELLLMTDLYTDDLFRSDHEAVLFPVSRLILDPERFSDDSLEIMSQVGMGVVYTKTHDGRDLRRSVTAEEKEQLLKAFYFPHHERFTRLVNEELDQNGTALIVDCHSFPSVPLPYEFNQDTDRPDICIGSDEYHTPVDVCQRCVQSFQSRGYSVTVNKPFSGSIVPEEHYQKDPRVHSIMIEVNRKLYMDESTGEKVSGYHRVKSDLRTVLSL